MMRAAAILAVVGSLTGCHVLFGLTPPGEDEQAALDASPAGDAARAPASPSLDGAAPPTCADSDLRTSRAHCGECEHACEDACVDGMCEPHAVVTAPPGAEVRCIATAGAELVYGVVTGDVLRPRNHDILRGRDGKVLMASTPCEDIAPLGNFTLVMGETELVKLDPRSGTTLSIAREAYPAFRGLSPQDGLVLWSTFSNFRRVRDTGADYRIGLDVPGAPSPTPLSAAVLIHPSGLYWGRGNELRRSPVSSVPELANGALLMTGNAPGVSLASFGDDVIWLTSVAAFLVTKSGSVEPFFRPPTKRARAVRATSTHAYFVEGEVGAVGRIWRVDRSGGSRLYADKVIVPPLRSDDYQGAPWDHYPWAMDDKFVYFPGGIAGARSIVRIPL